MKKMNPKVKAKWVKALRSGEYVQGKGGLCIPGKKHDTFCCLGVLTDLAVRAKVTQWAPDVPSGALPGQSYYNAADLPDAVAAWAGLDRTVPIINPHLNLNAIDANDDRAYSFEEIADLIEANL